MIVDAETNEDIFCFKPDPNIGSISECNTPNETVLPDSCEVSILDSSASKAIQREILELIHPILHSSLDKDDQIILMRVHFLLRFDDVGNVCQAVQYALSCDRFDILNSISS